MIRSEDGAHALASSGSQKAGEAVDLALVDVEIEGLDSGVAVKTLHLEDRKLSFLSLVGLVFAVDVGQVVQLLAQHLGYQLYPGQILNLILSYQAAVAHNRDAVADLIYLVKEVGDKDNSHASCAQVPHQLKELLYLLLIQGGSRLIQNQHLAVCVYGSRDGNHLLHRQGAGRELLGGFGRDVQGF